MDERIWVIENADQMQRLVGYLPKVPLEKAVEVRVRSWADDRSNAQNRRLFKLHSLAAAHTGYSTEEMHEHALCRHFGYQEQRIGSVVRVVPLKRSSTRNVREFAEFMTATEAFYATELGVWLE